MLTLVSQSSTIPVSASDLKTHLRITGSSEDTYLTDLIWQCTEYLSRLTGRSFVQETWTETFYKFPCLNYPLYLSKSPLSSITTVAYKDTNDDSQTLTETTDFLVKKPTHQRGYLIPIHPEEWPETNQDKDNVSITYVSVTPNNRLFTRAVYLLAGHWYEHREAEIEKSLSPINVAGLTNLINILRVVRYP